ncbi:MAG: SDR family oxidoreductase [Porticoccaceae bacterium]|jgi:NAD(P)-dependent dehydrogenase (short-subunit alcohol dehydrogenase family)|nr:SDR family oxidoreductase [Porticoccaceae bacterium]MDB2533888.1 SDR family oxidoreductase [Porticoccaceae bacterium]MDC0641244.1 SDR family oxidoreductase [Porticoccaceae bacterium]MDG1486484.1 SDR family NAD(P)-dependent oxidoreductase [Porticoccaceae bacterium]
MARLLNKVAIITGAASNPGLGYASAVRFAQEGAKLVITDIDMDGLAAAEKDLVALGAEVLAMEQNVVDEDRWQEVVDATVERFGSLDILVNNAGIALLRPISEYTTADYDLQMDVNIRSVFFGCRKALPAMIASGGGSIVNMSSVAGLRGLPGVSVYGIAKAGVQNLAKTIAMEHAADGIRCNSVHPGLIDTNIQNDARRDNYDEFVKIGESVPWGRMGFPEEVANCVLFLASDEANYVTGTELVVDGGLMAK